jgi:hypothetical protein
MGSREDFMALLKAIKAREDARVDGLLAGLKVDRIGGWVGGLTEPGEKLPSAEAFARGHPKVATEILADGVAYSVRQGSCFGWFWLIFTMVHCAFMVYGLSRGVVRSNHQVITNPTGWHFLFMALFYAPFFLIGFGFTVARCRIELTQAGVAVRWRILPGIGWTWHLPAGEEVRVVLAYRGVRANKRPVQAIAISSQGKELSFGSMLTDDVKEYLAAAILDYYQGPEQGGAPFIPAT